MVPLLARRLSGLNDVLGGPRGNAKVCESLSVGDLLLEPYKETYRKSDAGSGRVERSECRAVRWIDTRLVQGAR